MRAMVLEAPGRPLVERELPEPKAGPGQVLLRVRSCGVCRTDLHVVDGELPDPKLPLVPGHQVVGVTREGRRLGVPWLGWACGECRYCTSGRENLCDFARFTGYTLDGGYGERIGLYGFGSSAHLVAQVARWQGRRVFAFTRPGDEGSQVFARQLGAVWAGDSDERPPEELDAAILFAPAGELVPAALRVLAKGGTVVAAGIHMSDIPGFPYELLWGERSVRSVANLTRADGREFLELAPRVPVRADVETLPLSEANDALERLRTGRVRGSLVLVPGP